MDLKPAAAWLGLLYGLAVGYLVLFPSSAKDASPQLVSQINVDRCVTDRGEFCR